MITRILTALVLAPLVILLSLIAGYWLGAWGRTRPLVRSAGAWVASQGRHVAQYARRVGSVLSPVGHLQRLRLALALVMPRSVKLWMCTRCLQTEDDPQAWCTEFKSRVCQHLDMSAQAPLARVTEGLISNSPHAEPDRLRALARSLDGAIYGGSSLDFPRWKQELLQELKPRLLVRRRAKTRQGRALLPALNPENT